MNGKLLIASMLIVFSAMCLFGTSLSLNAERRGDSDTFDVSATFTAVDAEGNSMAGASVYCSSDGGSFSLKGTTNSEGTLSFTESPVTLSSGDCPRKSVTRSCYAQKGDAKTETVSETAELECRQGTSTSTPAQGDRADFDVLSGVPGTMCTGETRTVSLSAKNVGTTTWTPSLYRLASTTSQDWGASGLSLPYTISPGEKYVTSFQITAPSTPGTYGFQWEMKNGAGNFFGKPSSFIDIKVSSCAATPTVAPSDDRAWGAGISGTTYTMCAKEIRTISVEMKNEGTSTWTSSYALVPITSYNWEVLHVTSGETTKPGGTKKFTFNIVAPSYPDKYPLQWQMRNAAGNLFPEKYPLSVEESSPWMIEVKACATPTPVLGPTCIDSAVPSGMYDAKGTCTPAAGKLCIGHGELSCTDLCNPEGHKDKVRKYYCVASGPDAGACGFSDYQCTGGCQDGACKVCQTLGQSGSEACAAIGKSCVSSTCFGGCSDFPVADRPCDCTATCS